MRVGTRDGCLSARALGGARARKTAWKDARAGESASGGALMVARALLLHARAREMRHAPTPSEARLWERLRGSQLGVVFRRQVVIGNYSADFAASSVRLVVEGDGGCHLGRVRLDAKRDARLARAGWRVVRVSGEESLAFAVARVVAALAR